MSSKEFNRRLKQGLYHSLAEKFGESYAQSKLSESDDESSESAGGSVAPPHAREEGDEDQDFGPHGDERPISPAAEVAEAVGKSEGEAESEAEEPPAPTESADAEPTARYYNAMAVPNVL